MPVTSGHNWCSFCVSADLPPDVPTNYSQSDYLSSAKKWQTRAVERLLSTSAAVWVAKATCPLICRHFLTETTNLLHPDKRFVCRYWYFPQTVTKPDLFCVPLGLRLNLVQCKSTSGEKPCGGGASVDEPAWDAALAPSVSSASSALLIQERCLGTSTPSAFLFVIRKVFHPTHTTDFSRD